MACSSQTVHERCHGRLISKYSIATNIRRKCYAATTYTIVLHDAPNRSGPSSPLGELTALTHPLADKGGGERRRREGRRGWL